MGRFSRVRAVSLATVGGVAFFCVCMVAPCGHAAGPGGDDAEQTPLPAVRIAAVEPQAELVPQTGHSRRIRGAAFSPDGRQVLTRSRDRNAILWDAESGAELRTFRGHDLGITFVAFTPDGRRAITVSLDNTAILWNVATGEKIRAFVGHTDFISAAALSPGGRRLLTCSRDDTMVLWDTGTGRRLGTYPADPAGDRDTGMTSAIFSPCGQQFLSVDMLNRETILWDVATGKKLRVFAPTPGEFQDFCPRVAAFSPDGRVVVAAGGGAGRWPGAFVFWERATGKLLWMNVRKPHHVNSVEFSADGRLLLTGGAGGSGNIFQADTGAILWDFKTGEMVMSFAGLRGQLGLSGVSAVFSPDGRRVLTTSPEDYHKIVGASLWNAVTGEKTGTLEGSPGWLTSVAFSPDGSRILAGTCVDLSFDRDQSGMGVVLDTTTGKKLHTLKAHRGGVDCVAFSPDGRRVLTGGSGRIHEPDLTILWDATTGERIRTFSEPFHFLGELAFSPDGQWIMTGPTFSIHHATEPIPSATLWNAATGEKVRHFECPRDLFVAPDPSGSEAAFSMNFLMFSPDGRRALAGGGTASSSRSFNSVGQMPIWDVASGEVKMVLSEETLGSMTSAAFSPDGRHLLIGMSRNKDRSGLAVLWDPTTGKRIKSFEGHAGPVNAVVYSPNGKSVLTGSDDGSAIHWDVETGKKVRTLYPYVGAVVSVCFSPDGRRILTGSKACCLVLWDAESGDMLARIHLLDGGEETLVVTPEGYFDGPIQYVRHRKPGTNELYPVEVTKQFHRPDLVRQALGAEGP